MTGYRRIGSLRKPGHDYTADSVYFVTICVDQKLPLMGEVFNGQMTLSTFGHIAAASWLWLGTRYPYVTLDEWVVMPDHFHGIILLGDGGDVGRVREPALQPMVDQSWAIWPLLADTPRKSLGRLIGAFKTVSTKHMNMFRESPGDAIWQADYYDRIIRNADELAATRNYIHNNPSNWMLGEHHGNI